MKSWHRSNCKSLCFKSKGKHGWCEACLACRARTLATELATQFEPLAALLSYKAKHRDVTAHIVETNRSLPPDFINIKVDELAGDKPYRHIDDVISQQVLGAISEHYKKIAGFSFETQKTSSFI